MGSTRALLPRSSENSSKTHGKYGAWNANTPKKFMRMNGLRRLHTYTSMIVNAWNLLTMMNARSCLAEEDHVHEDRADDHEHRAEEEHVREIRASSSE